MMPRPTWRWLVRNACGFLLDYLRWCAVVILLALLVLGVPLACSLSCWWHR